MTENIKNSNLEKLKRDEIEHLEKEFGVLPHDYKNFLLSENLKIYNGKYYFIDNYPYGTCSDVGFLYALYKDGEKTYDISNVYDIDWMRVDNFIAIGHDSGGAKICIDLRPETKGHIYFYDTEGFDGQKFEEMIYKIANSFTEFIENLKDESEMPEL